MLYRLWRFLNFIFLPPYCCNCKTFLQLGHEDIFCDACAREIQPVISIPLKHNKIMVNVIAVGGYDDPLRKLVLAKNWSDYNAAIFMADLIWQRTALPHLDFDYLIPIPLHWSRYMWRGYNHAEVMAEQLARHSGKPLGNFLQRKKRTVFQAQLNASARFVNLKSAFQFHKSTPDLTGKHIVLVDDLLTTGATMQEAISTLTPLKPARISIVVTCRVI